MKFKTDIKRLSPPWIFCPEDFIREMAESNPVNLWDVIGEIPEIEDKLKEFIEEQAAEGVVNTFSREHSGWAFISDEGEISFVVAVNEDGGQAGQHPTWTFSATEIAEWAAIEGDAKISGCKMLLADLESAVRVLRKHIKEYTG